MKALFHIENILILCIVSVLGVTAFADWDPGDPHLWAQEPKIEDGWDVCLYCQPLADDFHWSTDYAGTETKITDIHFWISWRYDILPVNMDDVNFRISIYEANGEWGHDLRCPGISKPGKRIWTYDGIGNKTIRYYDQGNQHWYCPTGGDFGQGSWEFNNHVQVWQVNITDIWNAPVTGPIQTPIMQSPPNMLIPGRHYWLVIQADSIPENPDGKQPVVGWKISHPIPMTQCALFGQAINPALIFWRPLDLSPNDGQFNITDFTDMAFVLTNDPVNLNRDFGDAPEAFEDFPGHWIVTSYKTRMPDGANHAIAEGVTIGSIIDGDGDGQPTVNADGDDNNNLDDEDGVFFVTPIIPGTRAAVDVTVSCDGWIYGWMDFNVDGDWTDSLEHIFMRNVTAGRNIISFPVPERAVTGKKTYARFRFTSLLPGPGTVLDYFGPARDGEVEDYTVMIIDRVDPVADLGDAPDSTNSFETEMKTYDTLFNEGVRAEFPTVYVIGSPPHGPLHLEPGKLAYLGESYTLENEADQYTDQDDPNNNLHPLSGRANMDGGDDGVDTSSVVLPRCGATHFDVTVTIVDANQPCYLNAWIDFNQDGDWKDTLANGDTTVPEWAVQNQKIQFIAPGTYTVSTNSFLSAQPHRSGAKQVWMRLTLSGMEWQGPLWGDSFVAGSGPEGGYYGGETEDYYFTPDRISAGCADLDLSNFINLIDFGILSSNWGRSLTVSTCVLGDIDNSFVIDLDDLVIMAEYWLTTNN